MTRYTPEEYIGNAITKGIEDVIIGILIPVFLTIFTLLRKELPQPPNQNGLNFDLIYLFLFIIQYIPYVWIFIAVLIVKKPHAIIFNAVYIITFSSISYMIGDYISSLAMISVVILTIIIRIKFLSNTDNLDYYRGF